MNLTLIAGSTNLPLATAIAEQLGVELGERELRRFPDGELYVELRTSVRGHDVYLLQPTSPPAEAHLLELLLLTDACRRAGAAQLTAIMPYFAYARQDRRASGREPVAARLVADLLRTSGLHRVVAVDLHTPALEGFFDIALEHLSALPLLVDAIRPAASANDVLVAPDLGAAQLAERFARQLHLPVAIVHKSRVSGDEVRAVGLTGDVQGRAPLIVDDMISTAGTIEEAVRALLGAGCRPEVTVVASHGLFVGPAAQRLGGLPLRRLVVTDSVAAPISTLAVGSRPEGQSLPVERLSLAPLLAEAVTRLHGNQSLGDLLLHR